MHEPERVDPPAPKRALKLLAALAVMFSLSTGGPYGLESMVPTAGPGLSIAVLVVMAVVWALPYSLITAELASAMPEQGGSYRWYREFLSPFWAFQISVLDWITWILDAAIYPPLLAAYAIGLLLPDPHPLVSWGVCLVIIWGCTILNIRGVASAGRFTIVLFVLVLIPVFFLIVLGIPHLGWRELEPFLPEGASIHTALNHALIFGVWSYSGYTGLAYAGGEIVDGERAYPKVLAMVLPLAVASYVLPVWIGLSVSPDWASWEAGHFNQIALALGGTWLAVAISISAQAGNLSLFNSELLVTSRLPWAMARDGVLPPFFEQLHPQYGTPAAFLLIQAVFFSVVTYFLDFVEILVVSTWIALPSYVLTFVAPIVLRIRHPEVRGPFRIPGGLPVLVGCAALPTAISIYVLLTVSPDEIPIGLAFLCLPPLLYLWARRARRARSR